MEPRRKKLRKAETLVDIKDRIKKLQCNEDSLRKAFFILELSDDGSADFQAGPPETRLGEYMIEFAQFCQQPLGDSNSPRDWLLGFAAQFISGSNSSADSSGLPPIPSGHHRYIRLRTNRYYTNARRDKVWGTLERVGDGVICALYKNESDSCRYPGARVVTTDTQGAPLEMDVTVPISVGDVFRGIGVNYNGRYNVINNSCIHYAVECWTRFGGSVLPTDVMDGHMAFNARYNPEGTAPESTSEDASERTCCVM